VCHKFTSPHYCRCLRTDIQFNDTLQLDKYKKDQTIDKQYINTIKCIKFQGHQYTQDSECYGLWHRHLLSAQVDPRDTPLDKATYSCPCENTGSSRYTPTIGRVWPYALLIDIAKLRCTGNCFLLNLKGSDRSSDGEKRILGMKTMSPACVPLTISTSNICLSTALTTK
jgi:hypothetical protein